MKNIIIGIVVFMVGCREVAVNVSDAGDGAVDSSVEASVDAGADALDATKD